MQNLYLQLHLSLFTPIQLWTVAALDEDFSKASDSRTRQKWIEGGGGCEAFEITAIFGARCSMEVPASHVSASMQNLILSPQSSPCPTKKTGLEEEQSRGIDVILNALSNTDRGIRRELVDAKLAAGLNHDAHHKHYHYRFIIVVFVASSSSSSFPPCGHDAMSSATSVLVSIAFPAVAPEIRLPCWQSWPLTTRTSETRSSTL